VLVSLIFK